MVIITDLNLNQSSNHFARSWAVMTKGCQKVMEKKQIATNRPFLMRIWTPVPPWPSYNPANGPHHYSLPFVATSYSLRVILVQINKKRWKRTGNQLVTARQTIGMTLSFAATADIRYTKSQNCTYLKVVFLSQIRSIFFFGSFACTFSTCKHVCTW